MLRQHPVTMPAGTSPRRCLLTWGVMREHASQQENPWLGLCNLARALYEEGIIPEDSMQALGAFVAEALELDIDACM